MWEIPCEIKESNEKKNRLRKSRGIGEMNRVNNEIMWNIQNFQNRSESCENSPVKIESREKGII